MARACGLDGLCGLICQTTETLPATPCGWKNGTGRSFTISAEKGRCLQTGNNTFYTGLAHHKQDEIADAQSAAQTAFDT